MIRSRQQGTAAETLRRGFLARLRAKVNRGASWVADLLPGRRIDDALFEELETRLLEADIGVEATTAVLADLHRAVARSELADAAALQGALRKALLAILQPVERPLEIDRSRKPFVILVVGVNGSGKTTTIGKLASRLRVEGLSVMLAAGDTFRAAAVEQLAVWAERAAVPMISQAAGADPAAVVFDALQSARARGIDVLIADTAGRLHTQSHLMDELSKVARVLKRLDPEAPHEVLLVLDAGLGQNALRQAEQFHRAIGVTGIVVTKLDGTAKGGIVIAIAQRFGLPIRYVGVGEQPEDFGIFDAGAYVDGLLARCTREYPVIRFDRVFKRYPNGREALSELSFELATGEMTFLTGHSGAGKSTVLRLIALLERPTRGQVIVQRPQHRLDAIGRHPRIPPPGRGRVPGSPPAGRQAGLRQCRTATGDCRCPAPRDGQARARRARPGRAARQGKGISARAFRGRAAARRHRACRHHEAARADRG